MEHVIPDVSNKRKLKEEKLTIALMGRAAVGKTAILNRHLHQKFDDRYMITVGDKYTSSIDVDGRQMELDILDTPGGYCFEYGRRQAIINADSFALVYSVDEILSFQKVFELRENIIEKKGEHVPIVIVQTKTDYRPDMWFDGCDGLHDNIISGWRCPHLRVSAKRDANMSQIFQDIVRLHFNASAKREQRRRSAIIAIQNVLQGQQIGF